MRKILVFALIVAMAFTTAFAASSSTASVAGKTANIVTVDPGTVKAMLTLGQDSVAKDMNFSDHIAKAKSAFGNTPLMSINGTYFNSYYKTNQELAFPGNCALIQQTLMMDGEVVIGGGDGRKMTLGITGDGRFIVGNVAIKPYVVINGESYYFWGVNQIYSDTYAVELFTDKLGYSVPVPAGSTVLWIKGGRIERIENSLSITVPAGYKAVVFHQGMWDSATAWNSISAGDSAVFANDFDLADSSKLSVWSSVVTAVAGNPPLVENGYDATSTSTSTDSKLAADAVLQRSFAAVLRDGRAVFGTITASPKALAEYLISIGADNAVCLDGGASSALAYEGKTIKSPGRKLANVLHLASTAAPAPAPAPAPSGSVSFTDVAPGYWAEKYIVQAFNDGAISGTSYNEKTGARTFGPKETLSFAQFSAILLRKYYAEEYKENQAAGMKWSDNAYDLVSRHGLWNHAVDKDTFLKDIQRCDMASLIANVIANRTGVMISGPQKEDARSKIADMDSIPSAYGDDVLLAYGLGLLSGYSDGTFGGSRTMSRAEAAAVYCRMTALTD